MVELLPDVSQVIHRNHEAEKNIIKHLLVLETDYQEHFNLMRNEMISQRELAGKMWTISQRFSLINSDVSCCLKPDLGVPDAKYILLQEFLEKLKEIGSSNFRMNSSLSTVRKTYTVFESLCAELDMSVASPLVKGGLYNKPIDWLMEFVSDLMKFFHAWLLKLSYLAHQIDPIKADTIEEYKNHTQIPEDFEEFLKLGMTYCTCLRSKTNI